MSEFDNREKAFEKKFEVEEELKFKSSVRAARLLGQWAAGQLGLSGVEADAYALTIVDADLTHPAHADVLAKIEADLRAKGLDVSRHHVENQMAEFVRIAHEQINGSK